MAATTTSIAGDFWDQIAVRIYGSEVYTPVLQRNNPHLAGTIEFDADVVINCPEIALTVSAGNQPWSSSYQTL